MTWHSILEGESAARARTIVDELASELGRIPTDAGLDGAAGHACLFAYAARDDLGAGQLDAALVRAGEVASSTALWGGLAGIRFAVAHLVGGDEAIDALATLDDALARALAGPAWMGSYDLLHGLCGIGVATLEGDLASGRAIASRVVDHLEVLARPSERGLAWFTPRVLLPESQHACHPDGLYNLGLAHGAPGVIALLARCVTAGVDVDRATRMLAGAVSWLLSSVPVGSGARFPAWLGAPQPSRLAWCYGDLGVAIALLAAARATGNATWEREARVLARWVATRPISDARLRDASICHGGAGIAHLLHRLYQATGDAVIGDGARAWFHRLIAMHRRGDPGCGFTTLDVVDGVERWASNDSILTGTAGVALVLLAAITDVEPAWDRILGIAPALS